MDKFTKVFFAVTIMGVLAVPITVAAQAKDDWKTRLITGDYEEVNVYIKEYKPKKGVTCWVANAEGRSDSYKAGENVSISCIKE